MDLKVIPGKVEKVLPELAENLIKKWKAEDTAIWNDRKTTHSEVVEGLRFLLKGRFLDGDELLAAIASGNPLGITISAVKFFQRRANAKNADGVFGRISRNLSRKFLNCPKRLDKPGEIAANSLPELMNEGRNTNVIFYFIDESVKKRIGPKTERYVAHAWQLWAQYAKIPLQIVEEKSDANVVVEMGNIDGPGGTLGLAHVGGPGISMQLLVTIEEEEDWEKPARFVTAACHEFGHILGLHDVQDPSRLMNGSLDAELRIREPQEGDIRELRQIWPKAGVPGEDAETPSDDFPGRFRFDLLEGEEF